MLTRSLACATVRAQAQKDVVNKKKKGKKDDSDDDDEGSQAQKQKMKDDAAKVKAMQDKLKGKK